MILLKAWSHKNSLIFGLIILAVVILWPSIPLRSIEVWLKTLIGTFPMNILYPLFAIAVASYGALYVYERKVLKCCNIRNTKITSISSVAGIILGACPSCIPLLAFFFLFPLPSRSVRTARSF